MNFTFKLILFNLRSEVGIIFETNQIFVMQFLTSSGHVFNILNTVTRRGFHVAYCISRFYKISIPFTESKL